MAYRSVLERQKLLTEAGLRRYADTKWRQAGGDKPSKEREHLYTKHGTLKEGAYLRARGGGKLHEDEVEGALEHAEKEGDEDTAKKLRSARADLQTGERGGRFYVGPGGKKVYVKDY
jgi:hypothetical protein